jgi:ABC-type lipoprotein release transport system permease subunit
VVLHPSARADGPGDPVTVLVIALVMLGVSTVAAYLPARRATRLPPVRVSG